MVPGIGRVKLAHLENHFASLEDAWSAPLSELKHAGLDNAAASAVVPWRAKASPDAEMEKLERQGVQALSFHDPGYPARLREIYDYPPLLYVRGKLEPKDEWCLAVVGTRRATVYGKQVADEL